MSNLVVGQIQGLAANSNRVSVPSGHKIMQSGTPVNIYTARFSDNWTTASTTYVDITNLSITLTPISSSSRFFLILSTGRASTRVNNLDFTGNFRVVRNDSDNVAINGDSAGSRQRVAFVVNGFSYNADHNPGGYCVTALDSPNSSSQLIYKVQAKVQSASYPLTINGTNNNSDTANSYHDRAQTSFTILEIPS